jgi:hypothetical protein
MKGPFVKFFRKCVDKIVLQLNSKLLRRCGYKIASYESIHYTKQILKNYEVFSDLISILEKNSVKGVFVECGFGYGRSFAVISHFAIKLNRKIYGFDSFDGFPNVLEVDYSFRNPIKGQWAVRTLKEAKKSIIKLGIFENNEAFELMELVFDKNTKNPIPNQKIALLHIDLDLYEGYKYALEIFWDQIQIGGIILFDEYNHPRWPGATKAVNEFLVSKNINHHQKEIRGKYFIIKE